MSQPTSRAQLKDYCLRRLGFPVIDINVDDDQLEDRIDDALYLYKNYHFDGTERCFLSYQVTEADISNTYITLADSIIGVTRVFPFSGAIQSSTSSSGFNMFDINYQLRLNDFYNLTASSYTYYVIAREHLAMLDMIVTGLPPFTYNKKVNQLKIFMDWDKFKDNAYLAFECHRITNPEVYTEIYNDGWMRDYTTALFKQQWGTNLKKYGNYVLPGGLTINGQQIYDEASAEVEKLEEKLRDTYEEPTPFIVG
jgi:hypothetical protein